MKTFILVLFLVTGTLSNDVKSQWNNFKKINNKNYENRLEDLKRFDIFRQNVEEIERHNQLYENGQVSFKKSVNKFTDWTSEEFSQYLNKFKRPSHVENLEYHQFDAKARVPDSVDWRNEGAVTPVKNQGQCGSCWTFSATGSLESQNYIKTANLISLSEQELVDCSHELEGEGCNGGYMDGAFQYVMANGLATEQQYPYEAQNGRCRRGNTAAAVVASNYTKIAPDEEQLRIAIATLGPVSVAVDANNWHSYGGGIYVDDECKTAEEDLNHGVLAVGYGRENGRDYFLVKNSWGEDWGEEGYIRLIRSGGNICGITTDTSVPLI